MPFFDPIIEDEVHVLRTCSLYEDYRHRFSQRAKTCLFANLEGLFTDTSLIRETARFLVRANNRRFPKKEVTKKDLLKSSCSFGKAKNYAVSADLKMTDLGKFSTSYGFLGIAFNMMDSKNYDIAYVRPHAKDHCWELGYVENGRLFGRDFGTCTMKILKEFNLAVKIENGEGAVYVNGAKESDFTPFFPPSNKVATAMRNNMEAKMETKNLQICQEIKCVSRSESGKTMITKPLESYKDLGMSACEACTCQLFGQIRCGCRSADEQGVSCTSNMIPAVGHDCCARCVPPSAKCYGAGDPHYRSWDGRAFDYQGSCTYTMVKTLDFQVMQKNKKYRSGAVSITEYCLLIFEGDEYKMQNKILYTPAGGTQNTVLTPYKKYYNTQDYVDCVQNTECSVYIKNQKMLTVTCYPGNAIYLWIHGTYYEKTEGMCGIWDGNFYHDYRNKDGQIVNSPNIMGAAFRYSNNDDKQEPFKSCPVDVTQSFKNCMFDTCIDPSSDVNVCSNAAIYAKQCADSGNPVVGWRSSNFCPKECPDSMVYDSCGKGCFATCSDPFPVGCKDSCEEGCYCPQGKQG
ncbi:IgGFc-binding protein-like [Bolinopsis microptera]|uniref:IgGFc-binding protein-like n=1 Tax=Bolinopsis microptera TaxID=2820187 RepID=UPI00307A41BA